METTGPTLLTRAGGRTRLDLDSREMCRRATPGAGRPSPISMLGVPFPHVTLPQAVARIGAMIASGKPHQVVTANVDFLIQARSDDELRRIFIDAPLVLCDGTPLVWASRLLGNPLPERVAGADLAPLLIQAAAEQGWRLFFLGGAPDVTEAAVSLMLEQHPTLKVVGHYSPPFRPLAEMDHEEIISRVTQAQPDILFVSFGCPKAEKWISRHADMLGVPVMIGVGATVDFLAGRMKRAPQWMQRAGLEWAFRLWQEPRRLAKRYAKDLWEFGTAMAGQWWELQFGWRTSGASSRAWLVLLENDWQAIEMPEVLDAPTVRKNAAVWARATGRHSVVDLTGVRFIDSTGVGLLLWLRRKFSETGRRLVLLSPSRTARRGLRQLKVGRFFPIAENFEEAFQLGAQPAPRAPARSGKPEASPRPWREFGATLVQE